MTPLRRIASGETKVTAVRRIAPETKQAISVRRIAPEETKNYVLIKGPFRPDQYMGRLRASAVT